MTYVWILILIFCTMCSVHPGRHWVTAHSVTKPPVNQFDKVLSLKIGMTAILKCCVLDKEVGLMSWFKQQNNKQPQMIVTFFKSGEKTYHNGFQNDRFKIERSTWCKMIIHKVTQSDEALYYCAVTRPNLVFGDGTYLQIKGDYVTIASETSTAALCDNSVVCEPTLHGNINNTNTNNTTQQNTESVVIRSLHRTVIGLGSALGLCALLIFCLTYFILRRRKGDKINASIEDSPGTKQESEAESLNYAALQFSKRKTKAEKRKPVSSDECVYTHVKYSVKCNRYNL
ncbi:uncharacterized protein LOC113645983 isoform X1 [Tachysurus fulvidraco]|uniref:uncharacterized protein LOC113645983 isoform X1 n=1 Tax=Tachysurus fulvidraco TaxID=1234273 RepID=UPI001FEDB763|nr:uncharacterized protein LOC113645983 isoform X1 [Tachysurus fulvidraco]